VPICLGGDMSEAVTEDLLVKLEGSEHIALNVRFQFSTISIRNPEGLDFWHFHFDDSDTQLPISKLREKLHGQEDYFLAVVLLEDPALKKQYRPHRFVLKVLKQPPCWLQSVFRTALITALHRVQSEMEMQLRQTFYRQSDPTVSYSRVTDKRGQQLAMTHISLFHK
jgi:hypothetical protein